jgi:hypothetical protein
MPSHINHSILIQSVCCLMSTAQWDWFAPPEHVCRIRSSSSTSAYQTPVTSSYLFLSALSRQWCPFRDAECSWGQSPGSFPWIKLPFQSAIADPPSRFIKSRNHSRQTAHLQFRSCCDHGSTIRQIWKHAQNISFDVENMRTLTIIMNLFMTDNECPKTRSIA